MKIIIYCIIFLLTISISVAQTIDFGYPLAPDLSSSSSYSTYKFGGELGVGELGSAEYVIPIEVPQGFNGLTPQISICYNSMAGNGPLGLGFCIGGIPSITRITGNPYYDGNTIDREENSGTVILALDGQRLIRENSSDTYYLENDPYTQINLTGGNSTIIMNKDGLSYRFERMDEGSYDYCLKIVADKYGNMITYSYFSDEGYHYLSTICYGSANYRPFSIVFNYEESYCNAAYFNKNPQIINKRLKEIVVKNESQIFRCYSLLYTYHKSVISLLDRVFLNNAEGDNAYPVSFYWGNKNADYVTTESVAFPWLSESKLKDMDCIPGDLDGDGLDDIVFIENGRNVYFCKSNGDRTFSYCRTLYLPFSTMCLDDNYINTYPVSSLCADFDGDGITDLLLPVANFIKVGNRSTNEFVVAILKLSQNNSQFPVFGWYLGKAEIPAFSCADFFGIGLAQVMMVEKIPTANDIYDFSIKGMRRPDDKGPTEVKFKVSLPGCPDRIYSSDFDGDGLVDILVVSRNGSVIFWNRGTGSGAVFSDSRKTVVNGLDASAVKINIGDFNGDGVADVAYNPKESSKFYVLCNNGNRTFKSSECNLYGINLGTYSDNGRYHVEVADMNGDGKSELLISKAFFDSKKKFHSNINKVAYPLLERYSSTRFADCISDMKLDPACYRIVLGDFDGDGYQEYMKLGSDGKWHIGSPFGKRNGISHNKVVRISQFNTLAASFVYSTLADKNVYDKGKSAIYPLADIGIPMQVVSQMTCFNRESPAQTPIYQTTDYKYGSLTAHLKGRGLLGFDFRQLSNGLEKISNTVEMRSQSFYVPLKVKTVTEAGEYTSSVSTSFTVYPTGGLRYIYHPSRVIKNDIYGGCTTTSCSFNDGLLNSETITFSDGSWKRTNYSDFTTISNIPCPQLIVRTQKHPDDPNEFSSKSRIEYNDKGSVLKQIDNYDSDFAVTTQYSYDTFGNVKSEVVFAGTDTLSIDSYQYNNCNLMQRHKRYKPYSEMALYYDNWGNLISEADVTDDLNPLETKYKYDGWGRRIETVMPDGTIESTSTGWSGNRYFVVSMGTAKPWTKTYYDAAGLRVKEETIVMSSIFSDPVKSSILYENNIFGKAYQASSIVDGYANHHSTFDMLGRVTSRISGKDTILFKYGKRFLETTEHGLKTVTQYDDWGNVKSVSDQMLTTRYTYNSNGSIATAISGDSKVSITYYPNGLRKSITDTDSGTESYEYDVFGRVIKHTNSKGVVIRNIYENGLLVKTVCNDTVTNYSYDKLGRLVKTSNPMADFVYQYDKLGRIIKDIYNVDGKTFEYSYTYNSDGLLASSKYPDNTTEEYVYDKYGTHIQTNLDGTPVWRLLQASVYNTMHSRTEMMGNSLVVAYDSDNKGHTTSISAKGPYSYNLSVIQEYGYDLRYNLVSRRIGGAATENFSYDAADRLVSSNDGVLKYSKTGNILYKSDMGAYEYGASQPHAVTRVEDPDNMIKSLRQSYTYSSFKKPASITGLSSDGKSRTYRIFYGPGNDRIKSVYQCGKDNLTTYYLPGYEVENKNGVVTSRHYIYSSNGNLAAIRFSQGSYDKVLYALCDRQGSLLKLYTSSLSPEYSATYTPFGQRTVEFNATGFNIPRGYTMHEHLDEFGLINMNARLYDPYIARFLSPDPYIQDPENSQNFNRYSYCLNNPLKYTDPSGEFWNLIIGGVVGGFSNWIFNGCKFSWKGLGYFGVGALSGLASSGIGSGVSSMLGGGTFGAGFLGTELAKTASSSFISGVAIGGFSGSLGGSISSLGNNIVNGNSWGKSLLCSIKDGLIGGFAGGLLGGLFSGFSASGDGRDFLTGSDVKYKTYSLKGGDLPIHLQANSEYGCTGEVLESFSEYYGDNIVVSSSDLSSGRDLGSLAKKYGYSVQEFSGIYGKEEYMYSFSTRIGGHLSQGHCVGFTYDNGGVFHTVGINKVTIRESYSYFSKAAKHSFVFQIMNPLHGFESFRRFGLIRTIKIITQNL